MNQVSQMEGRPCAMWSRYLVTDHAALREASSAESEQCMKRKTANNMTFEGQKKRPS